MDEVIQSLGESVAADMCVCGLCVGVGVGVGECLCVGVGVGVCLWAVEGACGGVEVSDSDFIWFLVFIFGVGTWNYI